MNGALKILPTGTKQNRCAVQRQLRFRELQFGNTPGQFEHARNELHFRPVRRIKRVLWQHSVTVEDTILLKIKVPAHT